MLVHICHTAHDGDWEESGDERKREGGGKKSVGREEERGKWGKWGRGGEEEVDGRKWWRGGEREEEFKTEAH